MKKCSHLNKTSHLSTPMSIAGNLNNVKKLKQVIEESHEKKRCSFQFSNFFKLSRSTIPCSNRVRNVSRGHLLALFPGVISGNGIYQC